MDEQYLQQLWDWTTSKDATFKDRYTFESWSEKLGGDEQYREDFHNWVSSKDATFSERRPFNEWESLVKKKVVSEEPSPLLPPTPLVQEEEAMVSESPTPDGESVVTETEPVVTEEIDLETLFQPQEIFPQDTRGTYYRDPVKMLGMYPEEGALERAYKQRTADIEFTQKQIELDAPALEERQGKEKSAAFKIQQRIVEQDKGEEVSNIEGRLNRATKKEAEAIERLTPLITEELIRKEEGEVVPYMNREFGRYGFSFRRTGIGDAMEVMASGVPPIEIDLDTWTSGGAIVEVEKLLAFVRNNLDIEERTEAIETDEIRNAIRARSLRNKSRLNDDGTESIVMMASGEVDGRYVAYPTLFPVNPDSYGRSKNSWMEPNDPFAEAMERGEVFYFDSNEEAERFAEGSWKDISAVDAEADSFFNKRGLDYLNYRKNFDAYEDAMNTVDFIEDAPFTREELTPEQEAEFGDGLYINGKLRGDAQKIKEEAEEKANQLRPFVDDNDYRTARNYFDTHIQEKFQEKAQKAAQYNAYAKAGNVELERVSQEMLGVPVEELNSFVSETPQQEDIRNELWTMYQDNKSVEQLAADQYKVSNTYLDAKFDKEVHGQWVENWSAVSNAWEVGINNGKAAEQILAISLGLKDIDDDASLDEVAEKIIKHLKASETGKMGRVEYNFHSARGFQETFNVVKNDPAELAASLTAGSLSQMLPYGWKLFALGASTGTAIGAGYGALGFNPATVAGGAIAGFGYGARSAQAATAFAMEYTNAVLDAARNRGYDLMNPQELKAALQDENVWSEGAEIGLKRGIPIGLVDYLSGGLAGRVFKVGSVASKTTRIGAGLVERVTYDPAAEAAGEFLAQVSAGQDIEGKEIFAEAWGAVGNNGPMAAFNIALDIRSKNNVEIANNLTNLRFLSKENSSDEAITRWASNMERLGQISAEQNQRIQENVGLRRKAKELLSVGQGSNTSVTGASSAVEARTMELLAAQEELSSTTNRKAVFKDKIAEINNELQELATTKKLRPTDASKGGKQQTILAGSGVVEASSQETGTDIREGIKKYLINGKAFTREEFLNRLSDMSKSRLLKAKIKVKNDREVEEKAAKIMGEEAAPIVEDVVTTEEAVVEEAPVYEEPTKVTSPTSEKFATVNRNDGKGTVTLTEAEYNTEMEKFAPIEEAVVEEAAPVDERQKELDDAIAEADAEVAALRESDGSVSKENKAAFGEAVKKRSGLQSVGEENKVKFSLPSKNEIGKNSTWLSEKQAALADKIIQAIIDSGLKEGLSAQEISDQIINRHAFELPQVQAIKQYVAGLVNNTTEQGNSKQSFSAWRQGKMDSDLTTKTEQETVPAETIEVVEEDKKADIESRKKALIDIMEATGDDTFIIGVADGTFAGDGLLNMNENGDVVLTRFADSEEGLNKSGGITSPDELKNLINNFGGEQIPTSAIEGGMVAYQEAGGGVVGEYHIPLNDLIQLIKDGYIVFAGLGNKEFVLSPHIADKYLTKINGKTKQDAIQEQSPEGVDVQEPARDSEAVGDGDVQQGESTTESTAKDESTTEKVSTEEEVQPLTEEQEAQIAQELSDVENELDDDGQFQLETDITSEKSKEDLKKKAEDLMNEVQPDNVEEVEEGEGADPIPVKLEKNKEPVERTGIKRFKLIDIIGKKLNLLMADKLQIELQDPSKPYDQDTNPYVKMGGNFFPLMEKMFGKVAWASIDKTAANKIIRGAMEGDMSAVYNMGDSGVDSNIVMAKSLDEALDKLFPPDNKGNVNPKKEEIFQLIKARVLKTQGKDIKPAHKHFKNAKTLMEAFNSLTSKETKQRDGTMSKEAVDVRSAVMRLIAPEGLEAKGNIELHNKLRELGISIETLRAENTEQFTKDLPQGAITMIVEVQDENGVPVRERKLQIDKELADGKITDKEYEAKYDAIVESASMSLEQQKKEGIPSHPNYPVQIRGRAVALMEETAPFFDLIKKYKDQIYERVAGVEKKKGKKVKEGATALEQSIYDQINKAKKLIAKGDKNKETKQYVAKEVVAALLKGDAKKLKGKLKSETIAQLKKLLLSNNKNDIKAILAKVEIPFATMTQYSAGEMRSAAMSSAKGTSTTSYEITEYLRTQHEVFIDRLSQAFPSVEVVTSQAEFDAIIKGAQSKKLVTANQKVYGAVFEGKLYLNPNLPNYNTPIHEFGHIWLNVARELGKDTYKRGMELMTVDSPYYQQVLNSKEYGAIIKKMRKAGATKAEIEAYIKEEALATAIGDKGESFASAAQEKNFKNWLNELFEFVKKLTGISDLTADQLQEIGLDEFLQGVVVDIMSENEVFLGAEVKSFGEQLQLMTAPNISMDSIVQFGRSEGRSDAAIKELLKKRGFKVADINEAMVVNVDLTTKLPLEFGRVEGGVQKAEQLFTEVRDKLSKFAKGKRKKIPAKKLTKDETAAKVRELRLQNPSLFNLSDAALLKKFPEPARYETLEAPTMGEVRAKALELLRENPIFKEQKEGVQLGLLTSFDRAVGTKANKTVQQEVNAIKNNIKQRKKGIKSIKEAQRELRKALKGLPLTPEVRAIIKAVGDINEDNSLAMIEKISEAVDKIQVKDAISTEQKKALKDVIKSLKDDAKYLSTIKKTIARFMRKSLPISNVYSKSQLAKAVSVLTNINAKNHVAEAMRALDIVNEQREKMKNAVIKDMLKLVQDKAKKERGKSTKPKSKGLDAQGQAFFQEAAKVLKLVYKNDFDGMIKLAQELSDLDKIDAIIDKDQRGEKLTVKEQAMIDRLAAFDTFGDLRSMTLEDVINMSQSLKDVRSESIARLKANRLKRAQEMEALSTESVSQIKKGFKELFTIAGVLKNDKQLAESAASIREEFKRGGVTKAAKALVKKIVGGIDKINIAARVKDMVVENIVHLGTIMTILDKGGTFFTDNIYRPLNLMNENSRKGYRSQMQKLDNIANSISGITKGYTQIRKLIADGKLFIEGLDAEGVDADIEALKIDLEDGRLPKIEDVKRRLKALVKARMGYMGKSPKSIQEAFSAIDSQTDVDALVDSTLTFIEDVSEGYVVKGVTLTKNQMLRVYALSKNAVQRDKLRRQGLTDESLAKIEEFLGPQLLEFADATVEHLSNEYFESVNDVYSQTNDVNLDYIDNYFPTKSISKPKEKTFDSDSFEARFDAESPSATRQRSDEVSGVDLNYDFVTELNNHLNSMERFKAYAEGVKKIAKILALPQVASLLKQSGFAKMTNLLIDNEVNPYKTETTNVGKVLNAFYGIALGFKFMQLPKQMTSFVNAYSQYSYGKEGSTLRKVGTLGPDFLGFVGDIVQLVAMFRTNFSKARGMSSTFNDRVLDALQGNISALEGGIADQTVRGGFNRWWQVAKASPTTVGDILGVMGYMAVYNRNIKNGMSEAKALELFNDYNKTQQTRRGTELNSLQVSAKQKPMLRLLTAFSSTLFLQTNEIIKGVVNINRDLGAGKMPKKSDVRSVYLNMGVANVAFTFAANIFRIIQGDDDDREEVLYEMGKSMVMVNQLSKIPLYGAAGQDLLNTLEGNRWKSTGPVAPATDLLRDAMKAYSNKDIIEAAIVATEIGTKTNLDMVRSARIAGEGGDAWEATYKLFGVGTSYQPQGDSGSTNWLKDEDSGGRQGTLE